jgi:TrmH family RNA methyltransferase
LPQPFFRFVGVESRIATVSAVSLDSFVVVLHEPRNGANVGAVVRAMKNMGLRQLRLVRPASFDPAVVESMAHRSGELLAASTSYDSLDAALADATFVVGTSGRQRSEGPTPLAPRAIGPELLRRAQAGTVALLFGNEDNGLSNQDLARCHALISIPADPSYASLNLAQAVLLVLYELRLAALETLASSAPTPAEPPAPAALLAEIVAHGEDLLRAANFFKSQAADATLRRLGRLLLRAEPSEAEARLLLAALRALRAHLAAPER